MNFLQSIDFMQGLCCALGGIIIGTAAGWTLAGWQERRAEARRQRTPQTIKPGLHGGVETLTCDRRRVSHDENTAEGIDWLFKNR